jgi:Cytochrome c oxidase subunit IV
LPASSIWPLWAALTMVLIVLGPVFGWWISLLGLGMGIWSLTGWVSSTTGATTSTDLGCYWPIRPSTRSRSRSAGSQWRG